MCEASSFSLTILLESCVDQRYPAFSSRFSVVVDNSLHYATTVQEAINSIKLRYAVSIPCLLFHPFCTLNGVWPIDVPVGNCNGFPFEVPSSVRALGTII
jgi:hypothetical protein